MAWLSHSRPESGNFHSSFLLHSCSSGACLGSYTLWHAIRLYWWCALLYTTTPEGFLVLCQKSVIIFGPTEISCRECIQFSLTYGGKPYCHPKPLTIDSFLSMNLLHNSLSVSHCVYVVCSSKYCGNQSCWNVIEFIQTFHKSYSIPHNKVR